MHKEEIHSKLVAIMRERLATNLKQLPLIATTWAGSPPSPSLPSTPSNFAQTNAKQLRILSQVWCLLPMGTDTLHSCLVLSSMLLEYESVSPFFGTSGDTVVLHASFLVACSTSAKYTCTVPEGYGLL